VGFIRERVPALIAVSIVAFTALAGELFGVIETTRFASVASAASVMLGAPTPWPNR